MYPSRVNHGKANTYWSEEFHYYQFISSLDGFNTVEDLFGRKFVRNKVDVNLKVFNHIQGISVLKTLVKHIWCECRCELGVRKCNSKLKCKNVNVKCESKTLISIAFVKKIMPRILAYVVMTLIRIVKSMSTWKIVHAQEVMWII